MIHTITTSVGNFSVAMSYQPSADDKTLNNLTATINKFALQPMLIVADSHPELDTIKNADELAELAIELIDEAKLEDALFESTKVATGAGVRVNLSLKSREIKLSQF